MYNAYIDGMMKGRNSQKGNGTIFLAGPPLVKDTQNPLYLHRDAHKSPSYWSSVCLHNMANLAKEATTIRLVLEPLFHSFDTEKHWFPKKGLAFSILKYLQMVLEESDDKSHLLLSILIKHLELSQCVKQQASIPIVGAISDLIKHLRKCLQSLSEPSSPRVGPISCYMDLQSALEKCISSLLHKLSKMESSCGVRNSFSRDSSTPFEELQLYLQKQLQENLVNFEHLTKKATDAQFEKDKLLLKLESACDGKPWNETDSDSNKDVSLLKSYVSKIQELEGELMRMRRSNTSKRTKLIDFLDLDESVLNPKIGLIPGPDSKAADVVGKSHSTCNKRLAGPPPFLQGTQGGSLIGKQGATIKTIQDSSNRKIRVIGENLSSCQKVRLPRQLRDLLLHETELDILEVLENKNIEKMRLPDVFFRCALLSNFLYG
ncbi:hypothetical protein LXL04_034931 [Taraxacum kok-saghyz]